MKPSSANNNERSLKATKANKKKQNHERKLCLFSFIFYFDVSMRRLIILVLPAEEAIIALLALSLALPSLHLKNTSPDQIFHFYPILTMTSSSEASNAMICREVVWLREDD